jgi:2-oxoglutarate dehydrogenase E2 component (dihydrolipoamide succinyltransferase)
MSKSVMMPALGESVVEGIIVKWFVKVGDQVKSGDVLVEVETDKANAEVPATEDGFVAQIFAQPGATVQVGEPLLALSSSPGGAVVAPPPPPPAVAAPAPVAAPVAAPVPIAAPAPVASPAPAAPVAASGEAIPMPALGESVVEGIIVKWFVSVGDFVKAGSNLVEVETDKANAEVTAPKDGYVTAILAQPGTTVKVGGSLLSMADSLSAPVAAAAPAPIAAPAPAAAPAAIAAPSLTAAPAPAPTAAAAPAAAFVPLVAAPTTQPWDLGNGIAAPVAGHLVALPMASPVAVPAPIAAPAPAAAPAPEARTGAYGAPLGTKYFKPPVITVGPDDEAVPFNRRRGITAEHMVYSKHVSPQVPCVAELDMSAITALRLKHKDALAKQGIPLTLLAFVLKATCVALREYKSLNASVGIDQTIFRGHVNLGVAVETEEGLVVPVIRDADKLSVGGLAKAVKEFAEKARDRKITADDLAGGTFTVSNPGRKGNLFGAAIINQPQAGILRMGEIVKRAMVKETEQGDVISIRPMMYLTLTYDHRIIDGVTGNAFLYRVRELVETGKFELT